MDAAISSAPTDPTPSRLRSLFRAVVEDARAARRLLAPERSSRPLSWACLVLRAHGLHVLTATRLTSACTRWAPRSRAARLVRGALRLGLVVSARTLSLAARSEINYGDLEGGVFLSGGGHIIIGVRSIGSGTIVHDHVTLGRGITSQDLPRIGRNVWIGPGSVVFGRIDIGDGATILPGTVLSRSVPARVVVAGNPAVVVRRSWDNAALLGTPEPGAAAELLAAAIARGLP